MNSEYITLLDNLLSRILLLSFIIILFFNIYIYLIMISVVRAGPFIMFYNVQCKTKIGSYNYVITI